MMDFKTTKLRKVLMSTKKIVTQRKKNTIPGISPQNGLTEGIVTILFSTIKYFFFGFLNCSKLFCRQHKKYTIFVPSME